VIFYHREISTESNLVLSHRPCTTQPEMQLPPISSLLPILFDKSSAEAFLLDRQVFYQFLPCPICGDLVALNAVRRTFRCSRRTCRNEFSGRKHTFFFGSSLNCAEILHLAYMWLNKSSQAQAMNQTGHSSATVTIFHKHF